MRYVEIVLIHSVRFMPGWQPNNQAILPYQERFKGPDYRITATSKGYLVAHVQSGEAVEVPDSNVRWAVVEPASLEQPQPVVSARRGKP